MAADSPTIADLRRKAVVTDAEIAQAVDAYLADPQAGPHRFASGHSIDVAQAIAAHAPSRDALSALAAGERPAYRRTMVMTAVILAKATLP